ncbi:MAG: hypothetical protein IT439_05280 [Phycisphaerales bacterium]|nr:hypothetical protein [Phycisphaerales bacterium]
MSLLASIPFVDPLNLHAQWFLLLVPLALFVSMAYKAVRLPTLAGYWRQVGIMSTQIVVGMAMLGLVLYMLTQWILPMVLPMPGT